MKPVLVKKMGYMSGRLYCFLFAFLSAFLWAGCSSIPGLKPEVLYVPTNIYVQTNAFDFKLKRVAVLPITTQGSAEVMESGVETLQPLVVTELNKSKRFDVVVVPVEKVKQWTGQGQWKADAPLPQNLLKQVKELTGSDAVLFCQLTRYHPYQPMAVGWKLSLIRNADQQIIWSADEVFDAGNPEVAAAARHYYVQNVGGASALVDPETILRSPTKFGQYTLNALFATLPVR
jgi:hypothetical protein